MAEAPDALGYRLKIGLVIPSTNTTAQPEIDSLRLPGITLHTGRIPIQQKNIAGSDQDYLDHVAAMRAGIGKAMADVMTCGADHMIMGVALEAFWGGAAGAADLEKKLSEESGVPVTIGSTAVRDALRAYGVTSIAIVTPHMPAGDEEIKAYFVQSGFDVKRIRGLKCPNPRAIAQVPIAEIEKNLKELDGPDVQALVQLGTNLAGGDLCVRLEPVVGKPVIAINPTTYWHALRTHKITNKIPGKGRLLNEH